MGPGVLFGDDHLGGDVRRAALRGTLRGAVDAQRYADGRRRRGRPLLVGDQRRTQYVFADRHF